MVKMVLSLQCPICSKEFKHKCVLKKHMWVHESSKPLQCQQCDKSYSSVDNLTNHTRRRHTLQKPFKCRQCHKAFFTKGLLTYHYKKHTKSGYVHECPDCPMRFRRRVDLKSHSSVHSSARPFKCNQCSNAYKCKISLTQHTHTHVDPSIRQFKCSEPGCGKSFVKIYRLRDHIQRIHPLVRSFACTQCDKKYKCGSALKTHQLTHSDDLPWKCVICQKSFKLKSSLISHAKSHTGERPFRCPLCPKEFTHSSNLKLHTLRFHNPEEISETCPECGKKFARASLVKAHVKVFHQARPSKFRCSVCNYNAFSATGLRKHSSKHVTEKQFSCSECSSDFSSNLYLGQHVDRVHRNEKALKCKYCEYKGKFNSDVRRHEVKMHKDLLKFPCHLCFRRYLTTEELDAHVLKVHGDEKRKTYACKQCDRLFSHPTRLDRHMKKHGPKELTRRCGLCFLEICFAYIERHIRAHTNESPFICDMCWRTFSQKHLLDQHIHLHHAQGRRHFCNICKMELHSALNLHVHIDSVHHDTLQLFQCRFGDCSEEFGTAEELEAHVRQHACLQCLFCGTTFKEMPQLYRHLSSHTKEKPWRCQYCTRRDKSFVRKESLMLHIQRRHS